MPPAIEARHMESRIEAGVIQARQPHALRRVSVFASTLCRVRQGEKRLQWDEREMRAGNAQLIILPAGRELAVSNIPGPGGYYVADTITFPTPLLRDFATRYGPQMTAQIPWRNGTDLCVPLERHMAQAWEQLLLSIRQEAPAPLRALYSDAVLLSLVLAGAAGPLFSNRNDPLGERVQQLLGASPAAPWTVATVAQRLNIGASTLRRQLAVEGHNFRDILENVRLGAALQRLQTTTQHIGDIAAASGYASPSRFAVRFRAHFGLSPSDLRAAL